MRLFFYLISSLRSLELKNIEALQPEVSILCEGLIKTRMGVESMILIELKESGGKG